MTNEYRYSLKSNFGVNRLFVLVYSNQDNNFKKFKTWRYYLPKGLLIIIIQSSTEKNFYDQTVDSDTRLY